MKFVAFLGALLCVQSLLAQGLVDVDYEGKSSSSIRSTAQKKIFRESIEEISLKYIKEIIGEERVNKNLAAVKKKIIANHRKYIPIIKVKSSEITDKGTVMTVNLKLSVESLKKILLEKGLFYKGVGKPQILPMISYRDRVQGRNFFWWDRKKTKASRTFFRSLDESFTEQIKEELSKSGFVGLSPVEKKLSLPEKFQVSSLKKEDYLRVGQHFSAAVVIRGKYTVVSNKKRENSYKLIVHLQALQSSNGRVIGDVIREYVTRPGILQKVVKRKAKEANLEIAKELSAQVLSAWERGTFGSSLIKITFQGDLKYHQLQNLRKEFLSKLSEVKVLKERLMEFESYTFEASSSVSLQELANRLKKKVFSQFKVKVSGMEANELILSVKTL